MAIKHLLVSKHSKLETCQTDVCQPGLFYRFHSDTFLLALLVSWGYQTQRNTIKHLPYNWIISFLEVYK
jgi:hypothetical protein